METILLRAVNTGRAFEHGTKPARAREARAQHGTKKYGLGPGTARKNMGSGQARHGTGLARHGTTSPKARHESTNKLARKHDTIKNPIF